MKIAALALMASALLTAACSKSSDSSGSAADIASPADITADTFTSLIPRIRNKSDMPDIIKDLDLTYYTPKTANQSCFYSKILFDQDPDQDGNSSLDSGTVDIRDCYAESEFSNYSSLSVAVRLTGKFFISINGEPEILKGKSMNDAISPLLTSDSHETRQLLQTRLIVDGIVRRNGVHEVVETISLLQSGGRQPCKGVKVAGSAEVIDSECYSYVLTTQKLDDVMSDQNLSIIGHSGDIKAAEYTSKYYEDGMKQDVTADNWKGQVTYHGADADPSYSLTDGTDTVAAGD